jgi:exonuclease III
MRIISVNVNGIQTAVERGLLSWLQAQNADVICLQDTRASAFELDDPAYQLDGYFLYACDAEVPAQGGVALYSRLQPKAVITGSASRQPIATGATCKPISTRSASRPCCSLRGRTAMKT